ncbi:restriction endonuclease [Streptomyces sp. AC563]|uniref:restriction endonuclease n=2 Tax=Streptomyces buecherae TaxID=2763006 RepID=UPI00164D1D59|nr:restriction endonuclease [Streptomyces buecherae]MBC3989416.1 restriction endonuclease [Streptomyces buecherae]
MTAHAVSGSPVPARLTPLMAAYQELDLCAPGQETARGRRFNAFLAEVLRWGGLRDVVSDQRGLEGRDETDVSFMLGYTPYILEAKWQHAPVDAGARSKIKERLEGRPPGVRPVLVSMSGFTEAVRKWADFHAGVVLLDRSHVEAMVSGLISAEVLFYRHLAVTSRRGGSYVPLADLLPEPEVGPPPSFLQSPAHGIDGFPAIPEPGVTVTHVLTADGAWAEGEISGLAYTGGRGLLWTTMSGMLCVEPATGRSSWTAGPAFCKGPALVTSDSGILLHSEEAVLRMTDNHVHVVGGGLRGHGRLMPGPNGTAWAFTTQGPRTAQGFGGHTLTRLGDTLADSTSYEVDFAGGVHEAALTRSGTLFLAGGGRDVTTRLEEGLHCPSDRWGNSAPLTPQTALAVGEHTVLLAGPTGQGMEKSLVAVDTRTHRSTLLLRLPNTTYITGLAAAGEDTVYLLTDIRGNGQAPRPHLLHVTIPASARP